jgi:hypothetical protein
MMRKIYIALLAIILALAIALPSYSNQSEYQNLLMRIDTINDLIDQASNANSLWRETKKLSDSAREYANAKNFALANEILIEAEFQAKLGIQQAKQQTDINTLIPSYLRH